MKLERLKILTEIPGISGFEEKVSEYISEEIKGKADSSWIDNMGNLIALKKGTDGDNRKLLLMAHMDEVGLIVKRINDDGSLAFYTVGGVDPRVLIGKKVYIGNDMLPAVIGFEAIHLQEQSSVLKTPDLKQLSVYAGFSKKDEAKKSVKVGDPVFFSTEYMQVDGRAIGKAFDDRTGCEVLLSVLEELCDNPVNYDVYFAWVVQEEVGLRGSGVAARQVEPDASIIFEGTTAGDNPELPEPRWSTRIGQGPVLTYAHSGLVLDRRIFETILETAKSNKIPFQFKSRLVGGTDAARIARTASGFRAGVIATPSRYIHSPVSMIDIKDFENIVLLAKTLVREGKVLSR